MNHFTPEDWVDFARGLPPAATAGMLAHIEQGCAECVKASETWQLILELSRREADYYPPEAAVRMVKAAYLPEKPWKWLRELAQPAKLLFDNLLQPSFAMVRGSKTISRQLVHHADPYVVDVRLEADPARRRVFLMGQILNSEDPEESGSGIDVVLLSGEKLLGRTEVSPSGEFDLELGFDPDLYLFINVRCERAIGITLPSLKD